MYKCTCKVVIFLILNLLLLDVLVAVASLDL